MSVIYSKTFKWICDFRSSSNRFSSCLHFNQWSGLNSFSKKSSFQFFEIYFFLFFLSSFTYPQYPSQSHTIWEQWIIIVPASPFSSLLTIIHHFFVQTTCITPRSHEYFFVKRPNWSALFFTCNVWSIGLVVRLCVHYASLSLDWLTNLTSKICIDLYIIRWLHTLYPLCHGVDVR